MTGKMSWANLNEYVLSDIFDLLASTRDLYHCSLTCRHWHRGGSKRGRKWQTYFFHLTLSCRFAVSMRNDRSWKRRLCRRFRISPHSSSIPPGRTNWRSEYRRLTRSSPSVLSQVRPMCRVGLPKMTLGCGMPHPGFAFTDERMFATCLSLYQYRRKGGP